MWKVGCTRSGGPRLCTDRSEAETLDWQVKNSRNHGRWGEEERKKVQGTFFPPNRPTRHDHAEETLDWLMKNSGKHGRWGARGPVDLGFAPTGAKRRPWTMGPSPLRYGKRKDPRYLSEVFLFRAEDGT